MRYGLGLSINLYQGVQQTPRPTIRVSLPEKAKTKVCESQLVTLSWTSVWGSSGPPTIREMGIPEKNRGGETQGFIHQLPQGPAPPTTSHSSGSLQKDGGMPGFVGISWEHMGDLVGLA